MPQPMKISPCYTVDDWKRLTFESEEDWQKAVGIFEDRINGRFLRFVDLMKSHEFAGFAILAIDCLLVETLQQFHEGVSRTKGSSNCAFKRFLTAPPFSSFFDDGTACLFYDHVRNGILHQAELKKNTLVSARKGSPLVARLSDNKGLVINRNKFHEQLLCYFQQYVQSLRNPASKDLRANLKKKMDHICRLTSESD